MSVGVMKDGGGLPGRWVIYTQRFVSVVPTVHGDVTHGDPEYSFVSCPYSFPQHCMSYRFSVGTELFTNLLDCCLL